MSEFFKPSDLLAAVTDGKTPPNCDITLQMKPIYAENGVSRGVWQVDKQFLNGVGVAMGGYLAAAADTMMAYAISSKLTDEYTFVSIDLHTTFHRPVLLGQVEIEARVERLGRQIAYLVADVFQDKKKAASVVSSMMIIKR